jgi:hypothetical protein
VSRFKLSLLLLVAYWLGLQSALAANENPLAFPPSFHLPISPSSHSLFADQADFKFWVTPLVRFPRNLDFRLGGLRPATLTPNQSQAPGLIYGREANIWMERRSFSEDVHPGHPPEPAPGFIHADNPKSKIVNPKSADSSLSTKSSNCPADLETLTSWLLRDLPSYANRVMQRSRRLSRTVDSFSYVVVAGRPEFEPLSLGPGQYTPADPATEVKPPQQVFFTTLERQYRSGKAINTQLYHWVFLTQTPDGWRLAMMFSRIGSSSAGRPPTPPRESSNGVVGQGVSTWLRDCRAGAIRPPRVRPSTQKTG